MTPSCGHDPSDVATRADLAELRVATQADIAEWRDAMKADLADMRADLADMRADLADMKTDLAGVKTDLAGVKTDLASLRSETRQRFERVGDSLNAVNRRMDRLLHTLLAGFFAVAATMIGVIIAIL